MSEKNTTIADDYKTYTLSEVERITQVSRHQLNTDINNGKLEGGLYGKKIRYTPQQIIDYQNKAKSDGYITYTLGEVEKITKISRNVLKADIAKGKLIGGVYGRSIRYTLQQITDYQNRANADALKLQSDDNE